MWSARPTHEPLVTREIFEARRAELTAELNELKRRQANLINELERQQPSADPDVDAAWRQAIQTRFAATVAEQRHTKKRLADLSRGQEQATGTAIAPAMVIDAFVDTPRECRPGRRPAGAPGVAGR